MAIAWKFSCCLYFKLLYVQYIKEQYSIVIRAYLQEYSSTSTGRIVLALKSGVFDAARPWSVRASKCKGFGTSGSGGVKIFHCGVLRLWFLRWWRCWILKARNVPFIVWEICWELVRAIHKVEACASRSTWFTTKCLVFSPIPFRKVPQKQYIWKKRMEACIM